MTQETRMMLAANGYLEPVVMPDGRIACVLPLMYTAAIIVMSEAVIQFGYDDRWCYHSIPDALKALAVWQQTPEAKEPEGWHRHPLSGRRREHGDPLMETILF